MEIQLQTRPTLVLMAGLSGTGKTTLALALEHELQWPVIRKDRLKYTLLQRRINSEMAGYLAYELLLDLASDLLLEQQLSIILDSASLHRLVVTRAIELAHMADARLKVIFCMADQNIREQRIESRPFLIPSTSPTVYDPTLSEDDPQRFAHLPDDKLVLYTVPPIETYLETAISYVKS